MISVPAASSNPTTATACALASDSSVTTNAMPFLIRRLAISGPTGKDLTVSPFFSSHSAAAHSAVPPNVISAAMASASTGVPIAARADATLVGKHSSCFWMAR